VLKNHLGLVTTFKNVLQALVKRSQELTASAQDQTMILSLVTKVTNALDAIVVAPPADLECTIDEYRQVCLALSVPMP